MLSIGVDMVDIGEIRRLLEPEDGAFFRRTFTEAERLASRRAPDAAEYLATRFAVKEAVFKALAKHTAAKGFDFRRVETRNAPDGSPCVTVDGFLRPLMEEGGFRELAVSITTEGPYAVAFVVAQG